MNQINGLTASERILNSLGSKSFLSLWSYPNVFRKQGGSKEICDLLVLFGKYILIFSDKHVNFQMESNIEFAWQRWYKKAVLSSVEQLSGAKRWISNPDNDIYIDAACTKPLVLKGRGTNEQRIFQIAVTRGTKIACQEHFGGGSGSMLINTHLTSIEASYHPFTLGRTADKGGSLVHVFDDVSLEYLMGHLNTATDFINYLLVKEKYLVDIGLEIIAPGEEDLLAHYLSTTNATSNSHDFLHDSEESIDCLTVSEGYFENLMSNPSYKLKMDEDDKSFLWDRLIENFIENRLASGLGSADESDFEYALRALAAEHRFSRRNLAEALIGVIQRQISPGSRFLRLVMSSEHPNKAFVFLSTNSPAQVSSERYRETRQGMLQIACGSAKIKYPNLDQVIGIGFGCDKDGLHSEDLLYMDVTKEHWTDKEEEHFKALSEEYAIFVNLKVEAKRGHEYPSNTP